MKEIQIRIKICIVCVKITKIKRIKDNVFKACFFQSHCMCNIIFCRYKLKFSNINALNTLQDFCAISMSLPVFVDSGLVGGQLICHISSKQCHLFAEQPSFLGVVVFFLTGQLRGSLR